MIKKTGFSTSAIAVAMLFVLFHSKAAPRDSLRFVFQGSFGDFEEAVAIAADPLGDVYIIDRGRNSLQKFSRGKLVASLEGYGWSDVEFADPRDVSVPSGLDVFVADYGNHRVQRYDRQLAHLSTLSTWFETGADRFGFPVSIAVSSSGELYVVDGQLQRVLKFATDGSYVRSLGGYDAGKGRLLQPNRVRLQANQLVLVSDGDRVVLFDQMGNFIGDYGSGIFHGVRGIAAADSVVFIVDDSAITVGEPIKNVFYERAPLSSVEKFFLNGNGSERITDIALFRNTLYILTVHHVYLFSIHI